jgi:hypothetical protein
MSLKGLHLTGVHLTRLHLIGRYISQNAHLRCPYLIGVSLSRARITQACILRLPCLSSLYPELCPWILPVPARPGAASRTFPTPKYEQLAQPYRGIFAFSPIRCRLRQSLSYIFRTRYKHPTKSRREGKENGPTHSHWSCLQHPIIH